MRTAGHITRSLHIPEVSDPPLACAIRSAINPKRHDKGCRVSVPTPLITSGNGELEGHLSTRVEGLSRGHRPLLVKYNPGLAKA